MKTSVTYRVYMPAELLPKLLPKTQQTMNWKDRVHGITVEASGGRYGEVESIISITTFAPTIAEARKASHNSYLYALALEKAVRVLASGVKTECQIFTCQIADHPVIVYSDGDRDDITENIAPASS